jgi:hypothetical protein
MDNTNSGLDSSMMGFHNDGCDLVLSSTAYPFERIADNDAAECEPPLSLMAFGTFLCNLI